MGWWIGSGHSRPDDRHGKALGERHLDDAHHDREHHDHDAKAKKQQFPLASPPMIRAPMTETPLNHMVLFAILAGFVTGLLVAALNYAVVYTERLVYGVDHLSHSFPGSNVSPLRLAITLMIVGIVTSWAWYLLKKVGRPAVSVPGAMAGARMPVIETTLSAFVQVISVAAGAPVGRENAPRLAGGLAGGRIAVIFKLDHDARRILVASCAGAGLAASFHLPLAGALFALELLLVEMSTRTVVTAMVASTTAVATTGIFIEPHPIYNTVPLTEAPHMLIAATIVGLAAGLAGHWFGIGARAAAAARPKGSNILWEMPVVFLGIALAAHYVPGVSGSGRWSAEQVFTEGLPLFLLIYLILLRVIVILLSFRAGTVGGTLTPSFSLGALIGYLIGTGLHPFFPDVPMAAFAIMGSAAFLSTVMAAPMFGMLAAVEFTDMAAQGYLALFIAVITAAFAVRLWGVAIKNKDKLVPFTSAIWTNDIAPLTTVPRRDKSDVPQSLPADATIDAATTKDSQDSSDTTTVTVRAADGSTTTVRTGEQSSVNDDSRDPRDAQHGEENPTDEELSDEDFDGIDRASIYQSEDTTR